MRKEVIALMLYTLMISCSNQADVTREDENKQVTAKILKDVPLNKKGQPYSYYLHKPMIENKLGLSTLENGFDSLQIRFWYSYASLDTSQLVILKYSNKKWNAELNDIIYNLNAKGDTIQSITKINKFGSPKNGWQPFADKLFAFGIDTLLDDSKVANYPDMMDGDNVIIEVSTKSKYRIYSYKEPAFVQSKIREARAVEQILELVENEFSFPRKRKL